jgi:hypothetical protein
MIYRVGTSAVALGALGSLVWCNTSNKEAAACESRSAHRREVITRALTPWKGMVHPYRPMCAMCFALTKINFYECLSQGSGAVSEVGRGRGGLPPATVEGLARLPARRGGAPGTRTCPCHLPAQQQLQQQQQRVRAARLQPRHLLSVQYTRSGARPAALQGT